MNKILISLLFLQALILSNNLVWAQPSEFTLTPTGDRFPGYQVRGTVHLNGLPVTNNDWIAAFDPAPGGYVCSGRFKVNASSKFVFTVTVNNPDTPIDGGIDCTNISGSIPPYTYSGCEPFTLFLWQASTGNFYQYTSSGNPVEFEHIDVSFVDGRVDALADGDQIINFTGPPTLVLPVELLYFRAQPKGAEVLLEWATSAELNNDYFELQRSVDGRSYEALTQVRGAGTHEGLLRYEQVDERPLPGLNYYRLKQVDFDGSFEYSNVVAVEVNGKDAGGISLFPNPAAGQVTIGLPAAMLEKPLEVSLRDLAGREVLRRQYPAGPDRFLSLPLEGLPAGYYSLTVLAAGQTFTERLAIGQ